MRRNRFLTNFGSTISDIQLESGKIKKNPLKLILWIMVKLTSWGRLKDVQLQVHSLGLHIGPYGDVLRTSQGRPAADAFVGVTYRTIWGQPEDVSTFLGDVFSTSSGRNFAEGILVLLQDCLNQSKNMLFRRSRKRLTCGRKAFSHLFMIVQDVYPILKIH